MTSHGTVHPLKLLAISDQFSKVWGGGGWVNVFHVSGARHATQLKAVNPIAFHPKVRYSRNNVLENVV